MNLSHIKKIELEITSNCNAACPGCARTANLDILKINSFTLEDLKNIFPTDESIRDKRFKFCGVLGDPIANVECVDMVEYLTSHGGWCQLSTNGGLQSEKWWQRMGKICETTNLLDINFCIDGHKETNAIYRVNTNFKVIDRNMQAYVSAANGHASGTWVFIVFDHNEHELDAAREHATKLGLRFATRTGMRNSYHNWVANLVMKKDGKIVKEKKIITTTGNKEHSKKEQIEAIDKFIDTYSKNEYIDKSKKDAIINSIKCKYVHEGEIFIASDLTVWPCCFLWDSYFKNAENIKQKLSNFGDTWNSLRYNSLEEILNHEWYQTLLELSWQPDDKLHFKRCVRTCALNKAYHNEIKFESYG
jgi:MoaA/NifB/PqqE/SkfB family radical SAM enzyme